MTVTPGDRIELAGAPPIPGLSFRSYRDETDLTSLIGVMNAAEMADGTFELMSVATLANELANLDDFEPERDLLLAEVDGRLVAWSRRTRSIRDGQRVYDTFGWVHPDVRRRGLGTAMLAYAEARLRERAAAESAPDDDADRAPQLGSWSLETLPGPSALLSGAGYAPARWFFEMVRPTLDDLPAVELPVGLDIRAVGPDVASQVLRAGGEAFQDHWGARQPSEAGIRRVLDDPETDLSLWQVAWDGAEVAGSVRPVIYADENAAMGIQRGWLDSVSVRRPWRRRGLARALMIAALAELRQRGMTQASLGVDAENQTGALGLYEGLGFQVSQRSVVWRKPV
jgi:ribosomal protein S18 acetylase RimI-like enzyme